MPLPTVKVVDNLISTVFEAGPLVLAAVHAGLWFLQILLYECSSGACMDTDPGDPHSGPWMPDLDNQGSCSK